MMRGFNPLADTPNARMGRFQRPSVAWYPAVTV